MAITTYADIMSNLTQPVFVTKTPALNTAASPYLILTLWTTANNAGSYNTTAAGATLSSSSSQVTGQLLHINPASGNSYVAGLRANITGGTTTLNNKGPLVYLCDRLWHSGGYSATSTSAQTVNSLTWPARDSNGATSGADVIIGMEIQTAVGLAPSANTRITYTNQSGTGSRTGNIVLPSTTSASAGNIYFFGLQSGDTGVRSIQSVTLNSSMLSGTWGLVALRVLALMPVSPGRKGYREDGFTLCLPRLYDGSVPFLLETGNTANGKCQITYYEAIG
jgi:hypothetical protein